MSFFSILLRDTIGDPIGDPSHGDPSHGDTSHGDTSHGDPIGDPIGDSPVF